MFPSWRLHLCEARAALHQGRLDRACQVLANEELRGYRQTQELTAEVARKFVDRARHRLNQGDTHGGWHDLALAEELAAGTKGIDQLRHEYAQHELELAARELGAGRTATALTLIARLAHRRLGGDLRRQLLQIAEGMQRAERQLAEGQAGESLQTLSSLGEHAPLGDGTIDGSQRTGAFLSVRERIEWLRHRCHDYLALSAKLLQAMENHNWPDVLTTADKLLAVAPRDPVARRARREAWHAVGLDATVAYQPAKKFPQICLQQTPTPTSVGKDSQVMPGDNAPQRFLLWVDAVGGYLVVTDDEVVLGQPTGESPIAVPIRADLSRRHTILRRDRGNYVLHPLGPTRLDGQLLQGPTVLANHHEIELGQGVRFEFTRPHALSATARLTPLSHHRTEPRADAILLMADSCVLGSGSHSHIRCDSWSSEVVLITRGGQLSCRATQPVSVDGIEGAGPRELKINSRIEGDNLGISFEPL